MSGPRLPIIHGHTRGYNRGCRCEACLQWQRDYHKTGPSLPRKPCGNPACAATIPENRWFCGGADCRNYSLAPKIPGTFQAEAERIYLARKQERFEHKERLYQENSRRYNASPARREQVARWKRSPAGRESSARYSAKLRAIRNWARKREEELARLNAEYAATALADVMAAASDELLELIDEQRQERDWIRRTKADPWLLSSLDAVVSGRDDQTPGDRLIHGQSIWDDPTGDLAATLVDLEAVS